MQSYHISYLVKDWYLFLFLCFFLFILYYISSWIKYEVFKYIYIYYIIHEIFFKLAIAIINFLWHDFLFLLYHTAFCIRWLWDSVNLTLDYKNAMRYGSIMDFCRKNLHVIETFLYSRIYISGFSYPSHSHSSVLPWKKFTAKIIRTFIVNFLGPRHREYIIVRSFIPLAFLH